MATLGYSGFLEHPQFPTWCAPLEPPSIWAIDAIKWMRQLHCTQYISFDQCVCGSPGRKPTTLLLVRLPMVRSKLLMCGAWGRCNHGAKAHDALIGRDSEGRFNTAKAKVYPRGLNDILGRAMCQFAIDLQHEHLDEEIPQELAPFTNDCFAPASEIQPDYHGR